MNKKHFEKFLRLNPDAKRICDICDKPLGQELIVNGSDAHPRHSRRVDILRVNKEAIHAGSPYRYSTRALGHIK